MVSTSEATDHDPGFQPLSRRERVALFALAVLVLVFGGLVEMRSAFLRRHMTDLDVYLRAAWAVRSGADLYDVTEENGWHYQYPPLLAILLTPLADPPPGASRAGMLPFGVSVAIWYALSLCCLGVAVHCLASAVEERCWSSGSRPRPGCRRWWALRLIPALACLVPIGHTLMRGQVNLLLLALLAGCIASFLRGRSGSAGCWLAAAICLKVIPAFLILVPLWKRDSRCLASCAAALVVGLLLVPAGVFGFPRTVEYYREYATKLLLPGVGEGADESRAKELIEMTASDSQSILATVHNTLHLDRATRPVHPSPAVRWTHRGVSALLTLLTLAAIGGHRRRGVLQPLFIFGTLTIVMLLMSPICHLHYFCLCLPLVVGLVAQSWQQHPARMLSPGLGVLLGTFWMATLLPNLQGLEVLRDLGVAMYGALLLWGAGCRRLWQAAGEPEITDHHPGPLATAA